MSEPAERLAAATKRLFARFGQEVEVVVCPVGKGYAALAVTGLSQRVQQHDDPAEHSNDRTTTRHKKSSVGRHSNLGRGPPTGPKWQNSSPPPGFPSTWGAARNLEEK